MFEHSQMPVWCLHNGQWQWNNGTMNNDNGTMEQWSMEQWTVGKCVCGGGTMGKNGMPLSCIPLINTITCYKKTQQQQPKKRKVRKNQGATCSGTRGHFPRTEIMVDSNSHEHCAASFIFQSHQFSGVNLLLTSRSVNITYITCKVGPKIAIYIYVIYGVI